MLQNKESVTLPDLAKSAISLTSSLLKEKKSYNFMTESSFDAYVLYLNRLDEFLSSVIPYDFDNLIATIYDWNSSSPNSISNSIKNIVISNIFLLKSIKQ